MKGSDRQTFVSFEWVKKELGEVDAGGNVIAPGGRQIMASLHAGIRARGFQVTDIDMHETFGWCFDAISNKVPVWCLLQFADPWLLTVEVPMPLLYWICGLKPMSQRARICAAIHDTLTSQPLAQNVQWFSPREYNTYNRFRPRTRKAPGP